MFKGTVCVVIMILAAVFFTGNIYAAGDAKILRLGLIASEEHPVTKASKMFSDLVKERTNGAIEVHVFPGGTLGGEVEMQDMVSSGTLDMTSIGT